MKKRAIAAALVLLALSGCGVPAPSPSPTANTTTSPAATASPAPVVTATPIPMPTPTLVPPLFSGESHASILAAAAYRPLAVRLYQRATGATDIEADLAIPLNQTAPIEHSMFLHSESLCIAAQLPGDDGPYKPIVSNIFGDKPEETIEGKPIAIDALVFLVSENNAVDSVTEEQLKGVLLGEITNWKEVGGADIPIKPFPPTWSGWTMASVLSVVGLGWDAMPDAGIFSNAGDSGRGAIIDFADAGALAATSHAYATMQYRQTGYKMLAVNGVYPSVESIREREYKYTSNVCAVINTSTKPNLYAKTLYEYLETEESKILISECGYILPN